MPRLTKLALAFLLPVAVFGLAACGGGSSDTGTAQAEASSASIHTVENESARLELPTEVPAGAGFEVAWDGPDREDDYVTIVEKGADEGTYLDYTRTRQGSPLTLQAPDTPGAHEVRYVDAGVDTTILHAPITVAEVSASLQAPEEVIEGAAFDVEWTGPDNDDDYITIVEEGAEQGTYLDYTRTRRGSPLSLTAPEAAGPHEVRYVMDGSDRILARAPLQVTPASATLNAADTVMTDVGVEIDWTGPDNDDDYITIVAKGAPEGTYDEYTRTRRGSPLTVRGPEAPGAYEIRYVMNQSERTLARAPLVVAPLSASLQAPSDTTAQASLRIPWTGPDNPKDFVAIAREGAPHDAYESRALSRAGNPASLFAPSAPGAYEVRYVLAKQDSILAATPLRISGDNGGGTSGE